MGFESRPNQLDETNTSIEHSGPKSMDPYVVVISVICCLIFFIGFVWFLLKIIKKALKNRDGPNPLDYNVAMSNQLMLVSTIIY